MVSPLLCSRTISIKLKDIFLECRGMGLISLLGNKMEFTIRLNLPSYCLRTGLNPMLTLDETKLTGTYGYTLKNCVMAYRRLTIQPNKLDLVK